MSADSSTDKHTLSNYEEVSVVHADFAWAVDFEASVLRGSVEYTFGVEDGAEIDTIVLDTNHLNITGVAVMLDEETEVSVEDFIVEEPVACFGSALRIPLPETWTDEGRLRIEYETTKDSQALQWLTAEQTKDKQQPFLFTQCQAIHARSMYPCQDTPAVKFTFTSKVSVTDDVTVLMGAIQCEEEDTPDEEDSLKVFSFRQPVPVPSYLVSLAVGHLASRELSPRVFVWAEPSLVDAAAHEFEDTELYLKAGEALLGSYKWGHVHLLVMPPSFPYGGMEGNLINVTPTLLAGDKSLADVVAHELAHSWTGNLVTSRTWEHFWLNEGWTMMVQRKMVQAVVRQREGDAAAEAFWDFDSLLGLAGLKEDVCRHGHDHAYTCLVPALDGVDPDDSFSRVPYEKGYYLLQWLQSKVGGPQYWEPFMLAYIAKFANTSLTTADFRDFLLHFFHSADMGPGCTLDDIDWQTWLHTPGMPHVPPTYDTSQLDACGEVAQAWLDTAPDAPEEGVDISGWSSSRKVALLESLLDKMAELAAAVPPGRLPAASVDAMDGAYGFSASQNCEVKFRWLRATVQAGHADWAQVQDFLRSYGRMKYVRPLFRDVLADADHRAAALQLLQEQGPLYHPICSKMVSRDAETLSAQEPLHRSSYVEVKGRLTLAAEKAAAEKAAAEAAAAEKAAAEKAAAEKAAAEAAAAEKAAAEKAAAEKAAAEKAAAEKAAAEKAAAEKAAAEAAAAEKAAAEKAAAEKAAAEKAAAEAAAAEKAAAEKAAAEKAAAEKAAAEKAAAEAAAAEKAAAEKAAAEAAAAEKAAAEKAAAAEAAAAEKAAAEKAAAEKAAAEKAAAEKAAAEKAAAAEQEGLDSALDEALGGEVADAEDQSPAPAGDGDASSAEPTSEGGPSDEASPGDEAEPSAAAGAGVSDDAGQELAAPQDTAVTSAMEAAKAREEAAKARQEAAKAEVAAKAAELRALSGEASAAEASGTETGGALANMAGAAQVQMEKVLEKEMPASTASGLSTGLAIVGTVGVVAAVVLAARYWAKNRSQ